MNESIPPDLEERFLQPEGWRWHSFEREGRTIRFGSVFPKKTPDAVIICLQGVREFSEKYFETAHWCLEHNLAFWTFDWAGQGKSTRFLQNPQKRHSEGFDKDIEDLDYLINGYIKASSVSTDIGRIPMAMLAHSMGANIGLRYLQKHPETFECAALSSPMTGIKVFKWLPQNLALTVSFLAQSILGKNYVPGGNDWGKRTEKARLSSDPARKLVHNAWCAQNPDLQCGEVTFGWLYEAQKTCLALQSEDTHKMIITPCLFGIPGHEDLVDNKMTERIMAGIDNAKSIDYPGSYHEILMEKDEIRDNFLNNFYNMIRERIIERPETLKPF